MTRFYENLDTIKLFVTYIRCTLLLVLTKCDGNFSVVIISSWESVVEWTRWLGVFSIVFLQKFVYLFTRSFSNRKNTSSLELFQWNIYFTFSSNETNCGILIPSNFLVLKHVFFWIKSKNDGNSTKVQSTRCDNKLPIKCWLEHCKVWLTLIWLGKQLINIHRGNNNIQNLLSNMLKLENLIISKLKSYK